MRKTRKLLEGHKKVGKRFIPPMKQIPNLAETSYVDVLLPELIWIGLINDKLGYPRGARLFEKVVEAVHDAVGGSHASNYALISAYAHLSKSQKTQLLNNLESGDLLNQLRNYLAPLVLLYDECPLRFIGPPATMFSEAELIRAIKQSVGNHLDKYKTPGIVLHGNMLLARLVTRSIALPTDLPDFNSVIDTPDSDEAKRAAGFLRASAMAEIAMLNIDPSWSRYFWNRGAQISPCELSRISDSHD